MAGRVWAGRDLRASRGPRYARLSHPNDDETVVRMGHPKLWRDEHLRFFAALRMANIYSVRMTKVLRVLSITEFI
jgi:hypothetical protein